MLFTAEDIQKLRQDTGAGVMACKRALEDAKGNLDKAKEYLKEAGAMVAAKKSERETKQGLIDTYVHGKGRIGVMVEVSCESDFVAKNPEFQGFVHDLALQISAMSPKNIDELLKQSFIKDDTMTIKDLLTEKIAKIGENIQIKRFSRYEIGE